MTVASGIAKDAVVLAVLPHQKVRYGGGMQPPGTLLIASPEDARALVVQGVAEVLPAFRWPGYLVSPPPAESAPLSARATAKPFVTYIDNVGIVIA